MARGKHSGKNNTFFGDENYYRRNRYSNDSFETNSDSKYNFKEEINDDNSSNTYLKDNSQGYNSYEDDYDDDSDYDDNDEYDEYDEESSFNKKRVLLVILAISIILICVLLFKNVFSKKEKTDVNANTLNSSSMTSQYEGYKVLGQLKIDKLGITQYILDSTEEDALEKAVGKLYGGSLNNYGNFCIVGHNYDNIFANLSNLNEGDKLTIVDKKMQNTEYKITKIYSTEPDNLECLVQNDNKIEITLITCKDGSTERLIVKAEKVNQ